MPYLIQLMSPPDLMNYLTVKFHRYLDPKVEAAYFLLNNYNNT